MSRFLSLTVVGEIIKPVEATFDPPIPCLVNFDCVTQIRASKQLNGRAAALLGMNDGVALLVAETVDQVTAFCAQIGIEVFNPDHSGAEGGAA